MEPSWVKTEERLPDHEGLFLICYGNKVRTLYFSFYGGGSWSDSNHGCFAPDYWAPLPRPPKEAILRAKAQAIEAKKKKLAELAEERESLDKRISELAK